MMSKQGRAERGDRSLEQGAGTAAMHARRHASSRHHSSSSSRGSSRKQRRRAGSIVADGQDDAARRHRSYLWLLAEERARAVC